MGEQGNATHETQASNQPEDARLTVDLQAARDSQGRALTPSLDSDSEAEDLENAEPPDLYDPESDVKDAAWAASQRGGRQTDAILSCPCCLATCCIDCQQHDVYPGQYRAMFVTNCRVDFDAPQYVPAEVPSSKKRSRGGAFDPRQEVAEDVFHPICCSLCSTRLGLYDREEVFHFTSVLATEA